MTKWSDRGQRPLDGWACAALAVAVLAFYADMLFAGRAFYLRDMLCDFLPYRAMQQRALWSGHLPLWNHLSGCGQPFLGDPQCAPLYPGLILFHLMPLAAAMTWTLALHTFVCAAGTYLLMRHWRCETVPALVGALACAFGTFFIAWAEFLITMASLSWIPLVLWTASVLAQRCEQSAPVCRQFVDPLRLRRPIALMAIVLATQYLAGAAETFAFSSLTLATYVATYLTARHGVAATIRTVQGLVIACVLAAMLAAPDILLLIQHIPLSVRAAATDPRMAEASVHPTHWVTLFLPYLFGTAGYSGTYFARTLYEFWAGTFYIGILPAILAVAAMSLGWAGKAPTRERRVLLGWLSAILIFGVLVSSGQYSPVFPFLHKYVPGFTHMRWPAKCLLWVHFSLGFLAAVGAQTLLDLARARRWRAMWITAGATGAMGVIFVVMPHLAGDDKSALFRAMTFNLADPTSLRVRVLVNTLQFAGLFGILSSTVLVLLSVRRVPITWAAYAMLLVAFVDMYVIGHRVHPIGSNDIYRFDPAIARSVIGHFDDLTRVHNNFAASQQYLYANPDTQAYTNAKSIGAGNTWAGLGVHTDWSGGITLERYHYIYRAFKIGAPEVVSRLADLFAITHVVGRSARPGITPEEHTASASVFSRPSALPRALLVPFWTTKPTVDESMSLLVEPRVDPRYVVVLEPDESGKPPPSHDGNSDPIRGGVGRITYGWDSVQVEYNSDRPAILLLIDTWYPGWRAMLDGRPVPIYRANVLFRGVLVEAGSHVVEFQYAPARFRIGLIFSAIGMVVAVGSLIRKTHG